MNEEKENYLIFGGSGFIGLKLIKQLSIQNCTITVIVKRFKDISIFENCESNIETIYGELADYDLVKNIVISKSINTVIHLSSTLIPSSNLQDFINELNSIITPTIRLLPLFAKEKCKLIFFSSGGAAYGVNHTGFFSETDNTFPINYYGQSKKILEDSILLENRISNLDYLIIRPSNPFGIGQNIYGKQGIIAVAIGKLLNNNNITVWGDGSIIRDYIYIDDLVTCVIKIINSNSRNEIFNVGSGVGYSINEIVTIINNCSEKKINVLYEAKRNIDPPRIILDMSKFKAKFSLSTISIKEGVSRFLDYELKKRI